MITFDEIEAAINEGEVLVCRVQNQTERLVKLLARCDLSQTSYCEGSLSNLKKQLSRYDSRSGTFK